MITALPASAAPAAPTVVPKISAARRPQRSITWPQMKAEKAEPRRWNVAGTPDHATRPLSFAPMMVMMGKMAIVAAEPRLCVTKSVRVMRRALAVTSTKRSLLKERPSENSTRHLPKSLGAGALSRVSGTGAAPEPGLRPDAPRPPVSYSAGIGPRDLREAAHPQGRRTCGVPRPSPYHVP